MTVISLTESRWLTLAEEHTVERSSTTRPERRGSPEDVLVPVVEGDEV
jgi:hypothetical protein